MSAPLVAFGSRRPSHPAARQARPALEALEDRNLLDAASYVRALYRDILHRSDAQISQAEVNGWVNLLQSGAPRQAVVLAFVDSAEHVQVFVSEEYLRLLGRAADPSGLAHWTQQMARGLREDQVEAALVASDEYFTKHGGTNDGFLDGLYSDLLHRPADAAGKNSWLTQLGQPGMTRLQVAFGFELSHEQHGVVVGDLYQAMLHRAPDATGLATFVTFLDQGGRPFQVQVFLAISGEYGNDNGF